MSRMNRLANTNNRFQGEYKRVLCVCSAGLLRSPTAAFVLSQDPFNFNTRCAGLTTEYALIPVDEALLTWAQEIVCMEGWQYAGIKGMLEGYKLDRPVFNLDVEDCHAFRSPELMEEIKTKYLEITKTGE